MNKNTIIKVYLVLVLILVSKQYMFAKKTSLSVYGLQFTNIDKKVSEDISVAFFSFIEQSDIYKIKDCRTLSLPENINHIQSNFMFYGNIVQKFKTVKVELYLKNSSSGEIKSILKTYENINLMLIDSRQLILSLLNGNNRTEEYDVVLPIDNKKDIAVNIDNNLAGDWLGEDDIKDIILLSNNKGFIIFNGGYSISIIIKRQNKHVTIQQNGRISKKQVLYLPEKIIPEALELTAPIEWEFKLSQDGNTLNGYRIDPKITYDYKSIKKIDYIKKNVKWIRLD